jgi:hypothetical protein
MDDVIRKCCHVTSSCTGRNNIADKECSLRETLFLYLTLHVFHAIALHIQVLLPNTAQLLLLLHVSATCCTTIIREPVLHRHEQRAVRRRMVTHILAWHTNSSRYLEPVKLFRSRTHMAVTHRVLIYKALM